MKDVQDCVNTRGVIENGEKPLLTRKPQVQIA